jgi:hypothetical protein
MSIEPDVLAVAALAFYLLAACAVLGLNLVPSDVSRIADGTSAYALGSTAPGYWLQAIASGLGGLCLGAGLAGRVSPIAVGCLFAYGLARIAIVRYPTDPRGAPPTPSGRAHAILAAVAFVAIAVAAPLATATFAGSSAAATKGFVLALGALTTVTSLGSFVVAATAATAQYYGLAQRVFYAASFAWAIAMSAGMLAR